MNQIRWARTIVGFLVVAVVASLLTLVAIGFRERGREPRVARDSRGYDRFRLTEFEHRSVGAGGEVFSFEAGEIAHKATRLGPLTLNPVKEIEMTEVVIRLDVGSPLAGRSSSDPFSLFTSKIIQEALENLDLGFVRRVVIRELEMFFARGDEGVWEFHVSKATLGLGGPQVLFENGFLLVSGRGHQLMAKEAEWRPDVKCIQVRGPFSAQDAEGRHQGNGGAFSLGRDGELILQQIPCPQSR